MKERIKKYFNRSPWKIASDVFFWLMIILLLIPTTRAGFLSVVSKIRVAVFVHTMEPEQGPVVNTEDKGWSLVDLQGNHVNLGDFDGQVLLVNFWATWCPPCRAEMPSLEKLYKDYGSKIVFLLVSNEGPEPIKEFMDKKGYSFPAYLSLSSPPESMRTKSIPTTFILNKQGRQVFYKSGAFDWNSRKVRNFLDSLLAE